MLFKYKTISVSKEVEDNLDKIEQHKLSIIRTANIKSDGTLIHDEIIDENLIEIDAENDRETRTLKSIVQAAAFYFDEVRGLYLDNQLTRIVMYENGSGHKNKYLNYIPQVRSNMVPYRISSTESFIITDLQFDRTIATSGDVLEIRDISTTTPTVLYTLNVPVDEITTIHTDLNITLPSNAEIALYVGDIRHDNPSVVIGLRKIWTV